MCSDKAMGACHSTAAMRWERSVDLLQRMQCAGSATSEQLVFQSEFSSRGCLLKRCFNPFHIATLCGKDCPQRPWAITLQSLLLTPGSRVSTCTSVLHSSYDFKCKTVQIHIIYTHICIHMYACDSGVVCLSGHLRLQTIDSTIDWHINHDHSYCSTCLLIDLITDSFTLPFIVLSLSLFLSCGCWSTVHLISMMRQKIDQVCHWNCWTFCRGPGPARWQWLVWSGIIHYR